MKVLPLLALTVFGAFCIGAQTLQTARDPNFQGLLPYGGSEEGMYLLRTQHALRHPFTDATNGVWTGPDAPRGPQAALTEEIIGALFWWTDLSAPWVVFFLTVLLAPLVIPLSATLLRRAGVTPFQALCGALFFFWLIGFSRRLFHPGFSMPLVLGTLAVLWNHYAVPRARTAVLAGALLGIGIGVYFWAWTFLWAVAGLLGLGVLVDRTLPQRIAFLRTLPWLGAGALLTGGPLVVRLLLIKADPLFPAAAERIGLVSSHLPESWPRSLLTIVVAAGAWFVFRNRADRGRLWPLLAMLTAIAIVYNQQFVHGTVLSFSSHYIQYLWIVYVLLIGALLVNRHRSLWIYPLVLVSAVPLLLGIPDMRGRFAAFLPPDAGAVRFQHLRPALDELERVQPPLLLTDMRTADIVASYTDTDVPFTEYSGFLMIPDEEYAERACLSELFAPEPVDFARLVVHAEERLRVLRGQETEAAYEESLAEADTICAAIRGDAAASLDAYSVTHVLWDERNRPDWKVDERLFRLLQRGEGWSLWQRN